MEDIVIGVIIRLNKITQTSKESSKALERTLDYRQVVLL
jgi:hypothetical protein